MPVRTDGEGVEALRMATQVEAHFKLLRESAKLVLIHSEDLTVGGSNIAA